MSQRNGDRARFQINRKRKLRHRQRVQALFTSVSERRQRLPATDQQGDSTPPQGVVAVAESSARRT